MRVAVIGTGYVGLVTGASLAELGNDVACCDVDAAKVAMLNVGNVPIYEPGLETLVQRNAKEQRLTFTTSLQEAVDGRDVVFIAVGTPPGEDGQADLSQVLATAAEIGRAINRSTVVVVKSTVPVGTAEKVQAALAANARHPFAVVSNPEFLKEGDAINDFMKPNRVVIGTSDVHARTVMRHLYEPFVHAYDRILETDNRSAELMKYAANAMLATRVSFMNEMANLCEKVGADIDAVRRGVGSDPRIGPKFLFPGPGFGGSCFPKDLSALHATARAAGVELDVVDAVIRVNTRQKQLVGKKLLEHFGGTLAGRRITVWGLAFKPNTDDIRESPAIDLVSSLLEQGAVVVTRDPAASDQARKVFGDRVRYATHDYESVEGSEALVLMTEWREFRTPDFARIKSLMAKPVLVDGRNIWDAPYVRSLGFSYQGIGRGAR